MPNQSKLAWTLPEFSKGTFPLAWATPPPVQYKVVTSAAKVSTRAAAVAACQVENRVLVDVTAANREKLLTLVRANSAIKMIPFDGVVIASWYGNAFAGVALQMLVTKQFSMVALVLAPVYPFAVK
ncbi:hypothetical protein GGF32_008384 [Allomyces javanicus]|nr:hypothetical protein GGF32_008384 [Allomyces javanicus]